MRFLRRWIGRDFAAVFDFRAKRQNILSKMVWQQSLSMHTDIIPKKSFAFVGRAVILDFRKELHFAMTGKMESKRNFAKGRG